MKTALCKFAIFFSIAVFSENGFAEIVSQKEADCERLGVKVFFAGVSKHINEKGDPNESHRLVGLSYNRFELMRMKNSYRKTSVVFSRNNNVYFNSLSQGNLEINVRTGIASGYKKAKRSVEGVIPVVQPNLYYEHVSGLGFEFGVVPYSGEQSDGVITVNVSYIF